MAALQPKTIPVTIRACAESDMPAVTEIYAHHVLNGTASFELEAPALAEMLERRRGVLAAGCAYLIAEANGDILGYAYFGPYHRRPGYRFTVEDSVYVRAGQAGKGIGFQLLQALLAECETRPFRQMIAVIGDSDNRASIGLHRRLGFEPVGTYRSVGFKFGRWLDSVLMQKELGAGDRSLPKAGA
jgi:L-amino acid N-acyltransferase YncA